MTARRHAKHLADKTDAECRQLAAHYYVRARKAEDAEARAVKLLAETLTELNRVKALVSDFKDQLYGDDE